VTEINLEEIRARADDATWGPWVTGDQYREGGLHPWEVVISQKFPIVELWDTTSGWADAKFIAHARTDVPALLAEVDRLRNLVARVKELTVSTDGDPCEHDAEIPIGEIVRVLAEGGEWS
jgi:hypothetical protein